MDLKAPTILKGFCIVLLLITCIIFKLKDVFQTYFLYVKNLSTRQENAEQGIDFPALTLCLQPSLQKSALDNLDIHLLMETLAKT